jgi:hypothetical protein
MTTKIHAVKISAGALPVSTAPLTIASTWAPAVYTPPALDTPTGLAALSIADAAVISWVPTPGCQTVIETAPDVSAAPGTWTVRTQTADSTYTLPIPVGTVRWVRIKAVRYGRSSAYTSGVMAAAQIFGAGPGRNLVGNMSFETNTLATDGASITSGPLCNLWTVFPGTATTSSAKLTATNVNTGTRCCQVDIGGQSIANGTTIFSSIVLYSIDVPLLVGKAALVRGRLVTASPSGLSGCTITAVIGLQYLNAAGAIISQTLASTTSPSFTGRVNNRATTPTGTARSRVILQCWISNATGSTQVLTGTPLSVYYDDIEVIQLSDLDEDVTDGTTHGRIAMQDTIAVSGVNRLGVAVATSGQQVTARNVPATLSASGGSLWDGLTIDTEYTAATPAVVTVTVGAATLRASGYSPAYTAAAATVNQTRGTTVRYYAYYDDPTLAGGTKTLVLSTARLDTVNGGGRVFITAVDVVVPASGTGTGTGNPNLGGGGGYLP